jgi:serine/threonine protein phosphatase PrpC
MKISVAATTDVGRVRKKNEDRCGYDEHAGIYVVCDGMGGQAAGEVAAELAVRTILNYYGRPNGSGELEGEVRAALELANSAVLDAAAAEPRYNKMGSTVVAISIRDNSAAVANVGDSRGYLLRDGMLQQITKDHSLVAEQVRRGMLSAEQAESAPWKNIVTRALGSPENAEPDVAVIDLQPHDTLIAATDGVIKFVSDNKLCEIAASDRSLEDACKLLVQTALDGGSDDNATCMLIRAERAGLSTLLHRASATPTILGGER